MIKRFFADETGLELSEYAVAAALIALACGTCRLSSLTRPMEKGTRRTEVGSATPVTTISSRASAVSLSRNSRVATSPAVTETFSSVRRA